MLLNAADGTTTSKRLCSRSRLCSSKVEGSSHHKHRCLVVVPCLEATGNLPLRRERLSEWNRKAKGPLGVRTPTSGSSHQPCGSYAGFRMTCSGNGCGGDEPRCVASSSTGDASGPGRMSGTPSPVPSLPAAVAQPTLLRWCGVTSAGNAATDRSGSPPGPCPPPPSGSSAAGFFNAEGGGATGPAGPFGCAVPPGSSTPCSTTCRAEPTRIECTGRHARSAPAETPQAHHGTEGASAQASRRSVR